VATGRGAPARGPGLPDVKFTVEQNLKPDPQGGTAPHMRANLDRIETPDKLTVVVRFKARLWTSRRNSASSSATRTSRRRNKSRRSARTRTQRTMVSCSV